MPTNRRTRARTWTGDLTDYEWADLINGPGSSLLAGQGFWDAADWTDASPQARRAALDAMREAWGAHREAILHYWRTGEDTRARKPWVYPTRDPDGLPWAAAAFD